MRTNKFLNEKCKELGISAKEFAGLVGISYDYARDLLAPNSKKLPSDGLARKIVEALKLSDDEEAEFWKILNEDREELEEEPIPEPPPPVPPSEIEEIKENLKRLSKQVDGCKNWIKEVEEMFWEYREKDTEWTKEIESDFKSMREENEKWKKFFEEKIKTIGESVESIKVKQDELIKKIEDIFVRGKWWIVGLVGLMAFLFFILLFIIGVFTE